MNPPLKTTEAVLVGLDRIACLQLPVVQYNSTHGTAQVRHIVCIGIARELLFG